MYLSARELAELGIERDGKMYYIPCEMCGRKIRRSQYSQKRCYVCDYCKGKIKAKEKAKIADELADVQTKNEKRFTEAVKEIKSQVTDICEYERAIQLAKTRCEKYGSIPEAMVAIELLRLKHRIIPQQRIGKYKVDFVLPDTKTAIEVDGRLFHSAIDAERENKIQATLGFRWRIIHIPAELIRKDIRKLKELLEDY